MGSIITVISGKGGVGKSTVSAGLGTALTLLGSKVLLVDCDSRLRCLDLMLSTSQNSAFDLTDVINGEAEVSEAAVAVDGTFGLYVISAARGNSLSENADTFKQKMKNAAEIFDFIILDSPAGIGGDFEAAVKAADRFLVISTPEPVSIRDAETAAKQAERLGDARARLIINRMEYSLVKKGLYANADNMIDRTEVQLIGIVPQDTLAHKNAILGVPVKKGRAAGAFLRIAKRLKGERIPLPKAKKI